MMLTWQIIQKDLRRLTVPLGLWVLFVGGTTVGFGLYPAPELAGNAADIGGWIDGLYGGGIATVLLQSTVGALLIAVLVLEDPPGGTTAFWLTRPMSNTRLLAAKVLGGTLCIAVIPALALALCWLGFGFSLRETAWAAGEHVAWQIILVLPALAVMSLGGGLGRFAIVALATWLVVAFTVIAIDAPSVRLLLHPKWVDARGATMVGVLALGSFMTLVSSYHRRRVLSWVLWSVTLTLLIGLRAATGENWTKAPIQPSPAVEDVRWERVRLDGSTPVATLLTPGSDTAGVWLAPLAAKVQTTPAVKDGKTFELERAPAWGEAAALRVSGLERSTGPLAWNLTLGGDLAEELRRNPAVGPGEVRLAKMQARVLWEMPLRLAAEARSGAAYSRVVSLGWADNFSKRQIVLQERDARLAIGDGIGRSVGGRELRLRDETRADCFLLVNRARGYAHALAVREFGTARMNSMLLTARVLEIEPAVAIGPELSGWEEGAVLIKVRFTTLEAAVHVLPGGRVNAMKETKP